jgi:hypothetical protein
MSLFSKPPHSGWPGHFQPADTGLTGVSGLLGQPLDLSAFANSFSLPDPTVPQGLFGFGYLGGGHALLTPTPDVTGQMLHDAVARLLGAPPPTETPEQARRRNARAVWNERFLLWQKNASLSEEGTLDRASQMVRGAVAENVWLSTMGAKILGQGSWYNATNTRRDSDVDLRVQLPFTKVDYASAVVAPWAHFNQAYVTSEWTHELLFFQARQELGECLATRFGKDSVTPGSKAFAVAGVLGSRAKVDVVVAVPSHYVWPAADGVLHTTEGVAILCPDGRWIYNYPEQHRRNGIAKRDRTNRQFKKVVRIVKRLRAALAEAGIYDGPAPSFMVECLIYLVEDSVFTVAGDDAYGRVRRVVQRLHALLYGSTSVLFEINELKWLFDDSQAWTYWDAVRFTDGLVTLLGDL